MSTAITQAGVPTPAKPKKKMRPGGGKAKGNGFENQIAKKLSTALDPLSFIRSPGSGGRVGGKNFEKFGSAFGEVAMALFAADVVPLNEKEAGVKFLHSIECKAYKTADNFTALANGKANIFTWFEESVVDAKKVDKNPLLIWKWNNTPIYVAVNLSTCNGLLGLIPQTPGVLGLAYSTNGECLTKTLTIYLLDDLLKEPDFWCQRV